MIVHYWEQKIDVIIQRYIHGLIKGDDDKALCVILKEYQLTIFVNSLIELVLVGDSRTTCRASNYLRAKRTFSVKFDSIMTAGFWLLFSQIICDLLFLTGKGKNEQKFDNLNQALFWRLLR